MRRITVLLAVFLIAGCGSGGGGGSSRGMPEMPAGMDIPTEIPENMGGEEMTDVEGFVPPSLVAGSGPARSERTADANLEELLRLYPDHLRYTRYGAWAEQVFAQYNVEVIDAAGVVAIKKSAGAIGDTSNPYTTFAIPIVQAQLGDGATYSGAVAGKLKSTGNTLAGTFDLSLIREGNRYRLKMDFSDNLPLSVHTLRGHTFADIRKNKFFALSDYTCTADSCYDPTKASGELWTLDRTVGSVTSGRYYGLFVGEKNP